MSDNDWRKSTYSGGQGGECVEVGEGLGILIRDTKDHGTGSVLCFAPTEWSRLTLALR